MNTNFKDIMSKQTDKELIKIVTIDKEDYQPLAVEAAEVEIKKGNIDVSKIEQVKIDITTELEKLKQFEAKKVSSLIRFLHFIIDTFAYFTLTFIFAYFLGLFIVTTDQSLFTLIVYLILIVVFFGYYIFMETKYQKTIGKFITKTSVVTKDGAKPALGDILRRTFCRIIPFDWISFLFTKNGLHDRLSDTTLVKDDN
ncbi:MAG: RDD family protein [Chitinophagaceae bacterium]|nr:MAG: RDD family protein [Chitinophagaceae bacterium]